MPALRAFVGWTGAFTPPVLSPAFLSTDADIPTKRFKAHPNPHGGVLARATCKKRTQRPTRANRGVPAIAGAETKSGGCTVCSLRRGLRCAASAARTGRSGRQHFYGEGEKSTIMVADHDAECVRTILSEMGELCPPNPKPNPMYRTKTFMELLIDSVDVDVMAGFAIVKDGKVYDCALHKEQIVEKVPLETEVIPLQSPSLWCKYYLG